MKVAATVKDNMRVSSFALSNRMAVYDVSTANWNEAPKTMFDLENIVGNDARVSLLKENKIDVLLCAGIGNEVRAALDAAGIVYIPGVIREADEAVSILLSGGNPGVSECGGSCGSCETDSCGGSDTSCCES